MAWNEPGGNPPPSQDPWNRPPNNRGKKNEGPPDLDEIIQKITNFIQAALGGKKPNPAANSSQHNGLILVLLIPIAMLWLASGIYTVQAGWNSVELRLGKHTETVGPGLRWRWPWPVGQNELVNVDNRFSLQIGAVGKAALNAPSESAMLTRDEAIVDVRIEVQYQITKPEAFWFNVVSPEASLKEVVESATRERVGQNDLDDILTVGRSQLAADIKLLAQTVMDRYGTGITITNLNLQDAQPPEPVQDAFSDAIRAREDEQSLKNKADAYERRVVLEAAGEAAKELNNARGYHDRVIAQATGEAARFSLLLTQYQKAPNVTRERLYLETMESVLANTSKILMDETAGNLTILPLDQLLNRAPQSNSTHNSSSMSTLPSASPRIEPAKTAPILEDIPTSNQTTGIDANERSRTYLSREVLK